MSFGEKVEGERIAFLFLFLIFFWDFVKKAIYDLGKRLRERDRESG